MGQDFAYVSKEAGILHVASKSSAEANARGAVIATEAFNEGGYFKIGPEKKTLFADYDERTILVDGNSIDHGGVPTKFEDLPGDIQKIMTELGW